MDSRCRMSRGGTNTTFTPSQLITQHLEPLTFFTGVKVDFSMTSKVKVKGVSKFKHYDKVCKATATGRPKALGVQ